MLEDGHVYFCKAADVLELPAKIRKILLTPKRSVKAKIVFEGEDGDLHVYEPFELHC
jgi:hypothetical protein